ncbi:MAG: HEPN domain-containing protein [Desulfobaccales bacterium]
MKKIHSEDDGFTVEDMLHFGYGHIDAARALFEDDVAFLDSAGYLAHLGTEVVLKSWHLHIFKKFQEGHSLETLYRELKANNNNIDFGPENEAFLKELDKLFLLRYPMRKQGPIEVGSDMLISFDNLLESLWRLLPNEMEAIYNKIDRTKKGGRRLMEKKI